MKIKKALTILSILIFFGGIESCRHQGKSDTWSDAQKTKWKTECQQALIKKGVKDNQAKDVCDCMLKKTSEKYTPEEATKITIEEERKLWGECNYQW